MEHQNYHQYRKMDSKVKHKRIEDAQQDEKDRKPNPQGTHKFPEINWFKFKVKQNNQILNLCTYRYPSKNEPIAVVVMFHGLNSHIGHGAHIAHHFSQANIQTVGFDHLGFGRSDGDEGYTESLQQHLKNSRSFVTKIKQQYPHLPMFALGLSMGGMTSFRLSLKQKDLFKGVILMAPAIKNSIGGFLVSLTNIIGKLLPKKTKLAKPIYGKATKNPQITDDVKQDPYAFSGRVRLSTISMLINAMKQSPNTFQQYQAPFIIFQGGLDKLVNPEGAFQLYDKSKTAIKDKQLYFYENMWHDIWHEEQIGQIIQICIKWIKERISIKIDNIKS